MRINQWVAAAFVSSALVACGAPEQQSSLSSVSAQAAALETGCLINLPTRLATTNKATRLFETPDVFGTVVRELPAGTTFELETTSFSETTQDRFACPNNGFFQIIIIEEGVSTVGFVRGEDLDLSGFAAEDGNDNPQFPLSINSSTEENAGWDLLPDANDRDFYLAPAEATRVFLRAPEGLDYRLQLVRLNEDGTVTALRESHLRPRQGFQVLRLSRRGSHLIQVVSADGQYAVGDAGRYFIWAR